MNRLAPAVALVLGASALVAPVAVADDRVAPSESATLTVDRLGLPPVSQVHLANGLTVVFEENHATPFVSMYLRYAAGSADDPPGERGVATLTANLMFRGTRHVAADAYQTTLDRVGATDRGWATSADTLREWTTVPSSAVPLVLWLWSDQMGFFEPHDAKAFDTVRASIARERAENVDNAPYGHVRELRLRALYPKGHPYREEPLSSADDGLTMDGARRFHDRHLVPNNAALVLSGDFRPGEALEQIRAYFGPIPPGTNDAPPLRPLARGVDARVDIVASVQASMVSISWSTPPFLDAGDAELDVAAALLAGSRVSLLNWGLVDAAKVATSVTAHQASRRLGSDFEIRAMVAPGHSPSEVIAGVDAMLKALSTGTVKDDYFQRARQDILIPRIHQLDRAARRVSLEADYAQLRHDPAWPASDLGRYEAMTPSDVCRAISQWLTPSGRVVTIVTMDPNASPAGDLRTPLESP